MSFLAAVKIGDSVQEGLDNFFAFVPRLVGFLLILLIGYIVARVVKGISPRCSSASVSIARCTPVQRAST